MESMQGKIWKSYISTRVRYVISPGIVGLVWPLSRAESATQPSPAHHLLTSYPRKIALKRIFVVAQRSEDPGERETLSLEPLHLLH